LALLTRRATAQLGASLWLAAGRGKPAAAQQPIAPQVDMRPLSEISLAHPPKVLPPASFTTLDGAPKTLADYAGRPIVLNFWATWCVPCVAELPELDRLAASGAFTVLAVSADRGGAAAVRPFAAAHRIEHATLLLDPGNAAVHALDVQGFPTTLIIDAEGRLRGTLEGPAAWGGGAAAVRALTGVSG